jgi:hypothetical protein
VPIRYRALEALAPLADGEVLGLLEKGYLGDPPESPMRENSLGMRRGIPKQTDHMRTFFVDAAFPERDAFTTRAGESFWLDAHGVWNIADEELDANRDVGWFGRDDLPGEYDILPGSFTIAWPGLGPHNSPFNVAPETAPMAGPVTLMAHRIRDDLKALGFMTVTLRRHR